MCDGDDECKVGGQCMSLRPTLQVAPARNGRRMVARVQEVGCVK